MKRIWENILRDLWVMLLDIIAVNLAYYLALLIRFYVNHEMYTVAADFYLPAFLRFAPFYTVLALIVFAVFRLYGGMWQFAGINDMHRIVWANAVTLLIQILGSTLVFPPANSNRMPFSYYVIGGLLQFAMVSMIRFSYRMLLVEKKKAAERKNSSIPVMIIGAGETARKAIAHLDDTPYRAAVAVSEKGAGKILNGVPVIADYTSALPSVKAVFIADRKLDAEKRREIREKCEAAGIDVQDYTGALANLGGRVPVSSLLGLIQGTVKIQVDGETREYPNGEEALRALQERYEVEKIDGATIVLKKPTTAAYAGYDAWAKQHKEDTGEEVSFF